MTLKLPATELGGFYAEQYFTPRDLQHLADAIALVNLVPGQIGNEWVRCHELARWVATHLALPVVDGKLDCYEHSWLVTHDRAVLDVYVPGHVPQVALVDGRRLLAPQYKQGPLRTDIRLEVIGALDTFLRPRCTHPATSDTLPASCTRCGAFEDSPEWDERRTIARRQHG